MGVVPAYNGYCFLLHIAILAVEYDKSIGEGIQKNPTGFENRSGLCGIKKKAVKAVLSARNALSFRRLPPPPHEARKRRQRGHLKGFWAYNI
jgi:hypothetical protein